MTNEEMDRAIAEHLGWSGIRMSNVWEITDPPEDGVVLCGHRPDGKLRAVPRYSTDLNAMHKAEKAAFKSSNLWLDFACNILSVLKAADMSAADGMTCVLQTTAAQRAEAFLRTIGKYSDATHPLP